VPDRASRYYGLVETLTGYFHAADGNKYQTVPHIAEGQIGYEKRRIEGFLWFEANSGRLTGAVLNQAEESRLLRLCELLGIDPKSIKT